MSTLEVAIFLFFAWWTRTNYIILKPLAMVLRLLPAKKRHTILPAINGPRRYLIPSLSQPQDIAKTVLVKGSSPKVALSLTFYAILLAQTLISTNSVLLKCIELGTAEINPRSFIEVVIWCIPSSSHNMKNNTQSRSAWLIWTNPP